MRYYEMTNDEIVANLSGEAVNVGLLENGKNLIKTEQVLKDFTELKNGKQLEKELIATILSELKDKKLKEIL
uniref:hypothetical protein n=1 Tax=Campylobacter sputorum TaxID=206 RepID=UPI00053BD9BA